MKNTTNDNLNLLELMQPLLKWWWLLAISALLAAFSSAFYTMQQPLVYSATTTIMVGTALSDPNPNGSEFGLASQLAAAYADIANRSTIQNATKKALGLTWLPEYAARYIPNTQLLEITVVDTIPERAQAVSQTLADQLVLLSPGGRAQQGRQQFIETQLMQIEQAITDTDAEIARLELEMAQMFSARQIADTRAQLAALESKRTSLQNNYSNLFSNSNRSATNTVVIMEAASLPTEPLNDDLLRNVILAALLGGVIAGAGAYLLEYSNNTIRSEQEIQGSLGLPSLGLLPRSKNNSIQAAGLLTALSSRSELSDAYAALRLNVQTMLVRRKIQAVAITGPTLEERRPIVTANLCVELARAGLRVILVDADLHRPSQQRFFNLPNRYGLSTFLSDDTIHAKDLLQTSEISGLLVLTSGPIPPNPAALLGQHRLHNLLAQLRPHADLIIFDIPPINTVVDALLLANELDGVILTVVAKRTYKRDIEHSIEALERIDTEILGTVIASASAPAATHQSDYKAHSLIPLHFQDELSPDSEGRAHENGNERQNGNSGKQVHTNGASPSTSTSMPKANPTAQTIRRKPFSMR